MKISLRDRQSCVKNQSDRPTCAVFSATAFHEYQLEISIGCKSHCNLDLSEEFLYYHCKKHDGLGLGRSGTTLAAASASLSRHGQCVEHLHPYRLSNAAVPLVSPSPSAITDAKTRLYSKLMPLRMGRTVMEDCLLHGRPLIAVADWYSNSYLAPNGAIGMPTGADRHLGRHAVLIVEVYDELPDRYQIGFKNSWGAKWGDRGFGSFGLNYFEAYCRELWA